MRYENQLILEEIALALAAFVQASPLNRVAALDGLRIFEAPLLAVASAEDPLFARLGEAVNQAARRFLIAHFAAAGHRAMAPALDPRFAIVDLRSNWSERHAAYVAGMGTFGLSRSVS
jgi:epoxyqueuosine reductase